MPASALGHGAFPFWDASFVCQYWAFMELYQTQLWRDIYIFFFNACVLGFFFKQRSDKISHWHLGASPLVLWTCSPGATWCCCFDPASRPRCRSRELLPAALGRALSCPMLCCLQGDKAFLSACPSLLLSGDFLERRSCCEAVYIWGVSQSPSEWGGLRDAQHVTFPLHI